MARAWATGRATKGSKTNFGRKWPGGAIVFSYHRILKALSTKNNTSQSKILSAIVLNLLSTPNKLVVLYDPLLDLTTPNTFARRLR